MQFTEEQAKVMVKAIEKLDASTDVKVDKAFELKKDLIATKNDISLLREDLAIMRTEMAKNSADNLKWSFIFWSSVMLPMIGIVITMIFKLK